MNEFEIHFINEIKRLNIRKLDVLECLDITLPTLNSKIKEPGRFTVDDLNKLKKLNFNLKPLNL
jgi:hypothetical protein